MSECCKFTSCSVLIVSWLSWQALLSFHHILDWTTIYSYRRTSFSVWKLSWVMCNHNIIGEGGNGKHCWFSCIFPKAWLANNMNIVFFNISLCRHIMREWDSVTDRGRGSRVNLAVTAFSLLMNDVSPPPAFFGTSKHQSQQSDLALLLCKSWIFIRIFLCLEGWDSAGDLRGSHNILPLYLTVVNIDIVWCLVWTLVSRFS